jgi:UDP-GlcNAc:undecaprenyl-phosphate GlcNAc-1-phosphate transferase
MLDAIPFLLALVAATILTPLVRKFALKIGAVDMPAERKVHRRPMPRMGGLAIYSGFWLGALFFGFTHPGGMPVEMAGIFMGTLVLVLLGAYDDIGDAPVRVKLPVQIAAAHLAFFFGVRFDLLSYLPGGADLVSIVWLRATCDYLLTILWIVGVTNAMNFMDGLDGLASALALQASLSLVAVTLLTGMPIYGVFAGALAGGLAGFWRYNRYPATIFLGDTGSTFLGFTLACFSVLVCHASGAGLGERLIPLLILTVPLSDAAYAILRRLAARANVFQADRGHLHHRLLARGHTPLVAARLLVAANLLCCLAALLLVGSGAGVALGVCVAVAIANVALAAKLQLFELRPAGGPLPQAEGTSPATAGQRVG